MVLRILDQIPLDQIPLDQIPIVGSTTELVTAACTQHNASTPLRATLRALGGIAKDCLPPDVKYPILCSYLLFSGGMVVVTNGSPMMVANTLRAAIMIVNEP